MTPATPDYWNRLADEAQAAVSNRLLDVERLARAVYNVWERKGGFGPGLAVSERGHADIAEDFAVEYAVLLAATPSAEPQDRDADIRAVADAGEAHAALVKAIDIIEAADRVAEAADGPVGHVRDILSDDDWRMLYTRLCQARALLAAHVDRLLYPDAGLRPAAEPAGLAKAWRAVEAVLPDGWLTLILSKRAKSDIGPYSAAVHDGSEGAMTIQSGLAVRFGSTPEVALQRLAARLAHDGEGTP